MHKLLGKIWIMTSLVSLMSFVLLFFVITNLQAKEEGAEAEIVEEKTTTMPIAVKAIAAALAIGLTSLATAYAQRSIGAAGVGAVAENAKTFGPALIFLVIPETMVIFGFVIAAIILFVI